MVKGKKIGYLIYNFTAEKSEDEAYYKILIFFDSHGEISPNSLPADLSGTNGILDLKFYTKEDLAIFCDEFLGTSHYDGLYLVSATDFNIGMESGHNLQTFLEIFSNYGVFVEPQSRSTSSLLSKIF